MLLTEEEAKKRWCPMARVSIGGKLPSSMNRLQTIGKDSDGETVTEGKLRLPVGARCIASECMAFRWVEPPGHPRPPDAPERDDRGYCGLSGSPEK